MWLGASWRERATTFATNPRAYVLIAGVIVGWIWGSWYFTLPAIALGILIAIILREMRGEDEI